MKLLHEIRQDLPASIVVFFVAVPLCLGIALASGAPLFSGLIAGIIGGAVVGSISRSQLGVSGPAAGLAVIVLGAIGTLGFEAFLLAVVLSGILQIILGLARAGFIAYFFPSSVIKGMLAGIGVIIVLKQIPHAVGHDSDPEGDFAFSQPDGETTLSSFTAMIPDFDLSAVLIAAIALAILILWESPYLKRFKVLRLVQGPLVAVAFGIGFQALAGRFAPSWALSPEHLVTVPVPESFSEFLSFLQFPDWSRLGDSAIYVTAATLAVVASLETLLCVEATDKLDPQKRITPTNRELVAQGVGNVASGLVGGLPITQVIVRSSANIQSGARTKLSAILHGFLLFLFAIALPNVLNMIPLAVLASILFVVGFKLARPAIFVKMYKLGLTQFVPFVATILGIVFTDLLTGIGLGMGVAIFVLLKKSYRNSHFLHMRDRETPDHRHIVTIRLAEEVSFLNRGAIVKALSTIPDNSSVTIDRSDSVWVDRDVLEVIEEFQQSSESRNIEVRVISDKPKEAPIPVAV